MQNSSRKAGSPIKTAELMDAAPRDAARHSAHHARGIHIQANCFHIPAIAVAIRAIPLNSGAIGRNKRAKHIDWSAIATYIEEIGIDGREIGANSEEMAVNSMELLPYNPAKQAHTAAMRQLCSESATYAVNGSE